MAENPRTIMAKSDDELMFWTLAGEVGSYAYGMGKGAPLFEAACDTGVTRRQPF